MKRKNIKKIRGKKLILNSKSNKFKISKEIIFYSIILIIDIAIIIYSAKQNFINYAKVGNKKIFIGSTKNILIGRNYIVILTTAFFYIYALVIRKFLFKKNITKKLMFYLLLFSLILNIILFFSFTNRIY